ncbi:MAG: OmpA family protein, partial [Bacteroidales bacterium]|nr:OmpA family protein [Bacteroidales bacterium]
TIKKVFNWNQPGQKYHNLRTVFYRDLDGNHIKDANEPGVENVVLNIQNNSAIDTSYHYEGEMFGNMDVASNWDGSTLYEDIPEAQYYLTFTPTGRDDGKFALPTKNLVVDLKKDTTIYIPFNERNKVFGTIKFNRDKRSAVEDVQLGNIRVTITDSHGNTFSSLTDPTGYYEIFAPVADYYTVQVVNIWQEFFTIRQDRYIIKFNGYKTFEVNFEFDEKKREIFYNDDIDLDDIANNINLGVEGDDNFTYEDVTQIKQTILRGSVSDEKTYEPIPAIIEIMDISRHDVIAKVKCSETTGSFYTTFLTGNNYQMRVTAKGYWSYQELLSDAQITTFETINRDGLLLKKIEKGVPIELHNQYFNSNSSELTPEAKAELEDVVILLTNNEKVNVDIIGYTDNKENNTNELSRRRAKVVFDFIAQRGINASRLTYEGRGEIRPTERTDESRRECRRVDIVVK